MWRRENDFDGLITPIALQNGVDANLVKGLIGHESQFDPKAVGDDGSSFGLMQVNTGKGAPGEGYAPAKLLDPETNLRLGCAYLTQQIDKALSVDGGISAYNGGWRPSQGFGAPLPSGSFRNQAYVDAVKKNWAYFQSKASIVPNTAATVGFRPTTGEIVGIALALLLGLVAYLVHRG